MTDASTSTAPVKRMKLRYAGTCRACGCALPAGVLADHHRATKSVTCVSCASPAAAKDGGRSDRRPTTPVSVDPTPDQLPTSADPPSPGVGGASARREYERRRDGREQRIRDRHPRLGGVILALTEEPQSTRAWAVGAKGEEELARGLDGLAGDGIALLHDRRIPRTKANIDHIAIGPSGVFVIDAKRYQGRPRLRVEGGLLRPRVETLVVGRRDCSKLVAGVHKQVALVRAAVAVHQPGAWTEVHGMLCFVDGDWPMFGGSFTIEGLDVLWPRKAKDCITRPGALSVEQIQLLHRLLAEAFPIA